MTTRAFRLAITFIVMILIFCGIPLLAAQAASAAGSPLEPGQANESMVAFVWAYAGAALLEMWKKNPRLGGMQEDATAWAQRRIAIVTAILSAIGVHASFDAAVGTVTLTGLTMPGLWAALGDTIRQYAFQQFAYKTAVKDK